MNKNMMSAMESIKSTPAMDGITATKNSGYSDPGYVLELGGFGITNGGVVLFTVIIFCV